jgi:hypothetical protein
MADPIGNVLVGNRHRGFTMPIGRMSLNESLKPIGSMGFKDSSTFAGFTSSLPAENAGSTFWAGFINPYPSKEPEIKLRTPRKFSFTSSLPAENAGRTFWAGFASSLPAEGTTYSGKGWS